MKTLGRAFFSMTMLACSQLHAQFDLTQVQYWVGAGADTSILVVDFQDGSANGSSFAWGYLHNGATAAEMVDAIAAADVNLTVNNSGGFLSDLTYGAHTGIGGSPNYWSTWSGSDIASMTMNGGLAMQLGNGEWFGCSYTDFDPPLEPTEPVAAFDPFRFTAADVIYWVGTGQDSALLVIDFHQGSTTSSYAWGYLFDGPATGETMLNAIAASDPTLAVAIGGGTLNDITYGTHSGIGGEPDLWVTWSATNLGNWSINGGVGTELHNGDLFGCSYTDLSPARRPSYPVAAEVATSVAEHGPDALMLVYPQPATDVLHVNTLAQGSEPVLVVDPAGRNVFQGTLNNGIATIDVRVWPAGMYILQIGNVKRIIVIQ